MRKLTTPTKYKTALLLAAILIVQSLFLGIFIQQKEGFFIDETYSYGLSNGYYQPFLATDNGAFDKWLDESFFHEYITVQEGEQFAYDSVYYNQTQDVHPPIYYFLLHTVSSMFPNTFSKWFAFSINLLAFVICNIFLFLIAKKLFKNSWLAILPMFIYGFSLMGINNATYFRMYMLMTMFTVISAYLHIKLADRWRPLLLVFIPIVFIFGFLTQYYFIFFAFFMAAAFCIYKLVKRQIKHFFIYGAIMIGAVGASVALYPACINHLFNDGFVATQTRENILGFSNYFATLKRYFLASYQSVFYTFKLLPVLLAVVVLLVLFAIVRCIVKIKQKNKLGEKIQVKTWLKSKCGYTEILGLLLLLITGLSFFVQTKLAVVFTERYIYNLYPFFALLLVWLVYEYHQLFFKGVKMMKLAYIAMAVLFIFIFTHILLQYNVNFLYKENVQKMEDIKKYSENYCLYIGDRYNAPITQDLFELCVYKGVYVTANTNIEKFDEIFENKDIRNGIIVYVDTSEFWSSGYNAGKEIEKVKQVSGFKNSTLLYDYGLSSSYYIN